MSAILRRALPSVYRPFALPSVSFYLLRLSGSLLTPTEGRNNLVRWVSFSPVRKCIILRYFFCLYYLQHAKKHGAIYTVCSRRHPCYY